MVEEKPNWLAAALRKDGAAKPPHLTSDRAKDLIARALLKPGSLSSEEVQELAASALSFLVEAKAPD